MGGKLLTDDATPDPAFGIADEAALRALFPPTHALAVDKVQDRLDAHARAFIARAPFLCLGTQGRDGRADVSPRGDPPGFVRVLGPKALAIPERPGNNRLDSLANILVNPAVGLLFMVPGFDDTLRVNGTARLSNDPALLDSLAVEGRAPRLAIVVTVKEVFLHCAKAFRRSRLWDAAARQDRRDMPSLMAIILDQTTGAPEDPSEMEMLEAGLEDEYRKTLY
jgi:PPOX class probable FMN-dependent enzyme